MTSVYKTKRLMHRMYAFVLPRMTLVAPRNMTSVYKTKRLMRSMKHMIQHGTSSSSSSSICTPLADENIQGSASPIPMLMVWVPKQLAMAMEPYPFLDTASDSRVSGVCAATETTRRPKNDMGMPETFTQRSTILEIRNENTATQKNDMKNVNKYQFSFSVPYSH